MSKLMYSWLFIGPTEHHHTTQTSKFKNILNGASTMLNNVFKLNLCNSNTLEVDMFPSTDPTKCVVGDEELAHT